MDSENVITLESLKGKSTNDILTLLNNKFHPPRYINPSQFKAGSKVADEAIDTDNWTYVKPNVQNTAWVPSGGNILNDDYLIVELLNNSKLVEEATLPRKDGSTKGGRRRAQRKTKAKSKKRANKRRTRSRK